MISRVSKLERLEAGTNWVRSAHIENLGRQRLDYEYRMVCSAHYYGKDCDIICKPRNDNFGHYTCGNNGEKVCLGGWEKNSENSARDDYCLKRKSTQLSPLSILK